MLGFAAFDAFPPVTSGKAYFPSRQEGAPPFQKERALTALDS